MTIPSRWRTIVIGHNPRGPENLAAQMEQMLFAHFLVQGIRVAAELGIADILAGRSLTSDELADATGAHGPSLHRLLRMLASFGVFGQDATGRFALTPLGATLRSDGPVSLRDLAILHGAPAFWQAWGELQHSIMTGESAFEHVYGKPFYEYAGQQSALHAAFNGWMTRQSEQHNAALVAAYDFSGLGLLVDVGGGRGATLAAILQANPAARGILFDLPQVIGDGRLPEIVGVAERCQVIDGDMLNAVPAGADCYILKRVFMDKSDEQAVKVLRICADALADQGRIVLVEPIIPPADEPSPNTILDVHMLVIIGSGRVRTEAEFRRLFDAAGLRLMRIIPNASPNSIIEGIPG
jgi:hypothetical protein